MALLKPLANVNLKAVIHSEHYKRFHPVCHASDSRRNMGPSSIDAANMNPFNLKFACVKYNNKVLKLEKISHVEHCSHC